MVEVVEGTILRCLKRKKKEQVSIIIFSFDTVQRRLPINFYYLELRVCKREILRWLEGCGGIGGHKPSDTIVNDVVKVVILPPALVLNFLWWQGGGAAFLRRKCLKEIETPFLLWKRINRFGTKLKTVSKYLFNK